MYISNQINIMLFELQMQFEFRFFLFTTAARGNEIAFVFSIEEREVIAYFAFFTITSRIRIKST